jgi:hypothetical protein
MLRFPDRPGALPLNLIWNFETTSGLIMMMFGVYRQIMLICEL